MELAIHRTVLLDKKGLSLVEVMIALLVLLLVSLAMMQTALMSIEANTKNFLRDEAVSIADMRMTEARTWAATEDTFNNKLVQEGADTVIERSVRNKGVVPFGTRMSVIAEPVRGSRQVTIRVSWQWKGETYTHTITSLMRRPL